MSYRRVKLLFYNFAFFDDFLLIYPLYAVMFSDKGLGAAQISSLFIVWSVVSMLLEVPAGFIADKYARKNVLLVAVFLKALAFSAWLLFPHYAGFLLGFVLWGASGSLVSGTEEALVYDELKKAEHSQDYAKVTGRMSSLRITATIAAGFLASPLIRFGYSFVLIMSVLAIVLSAIPVYLLPKAKPVEEVEESHYLKHIREGARLILGNRKLLFIIVFASIVTGLSSADEYYGLFFRDKGFSLSWIALLEGFVGIFGAIAGVLAYKLEHKKIPFTATMLAGAGVLLAATLLPKLLAALALGVYVGYIAVVSVLFNSYLQAEASDRHRATMTSISALTIEFFVLLAYGVFAVASQLRDYVYSFKVLSALLVLLAVTYGLLSRKYNSQIKEFS